MGATYSNVKMPTITDTSAEIHSNEALRTPRAGFDGAVAEARSELRVDHFAILGQCVKLHTVGARLHDHLTAALSHLTDRSSQGSPCELSVFIWDADLIGVPQPHPMLPGFPVDQEHMEVSEDHCRVRDQRGQWAMELDRSRAEIIGCARLLGARPLLHDLGKPLQTLISVWARDIGVPLIHAGMVARGGEGILLGGTGGAGKSTTTMACVHAGFDFLGDDRIALETVGSGFIGHSIYNSVFLDHQQLKRFPELSMHAIATEHPTRERKPLILLSQAYPQRLPPSATIRAVVLPHVAGGKESRIRRASPAEALRVIAPSSLIVPAGPGAVGMSRLAALIRAVPCFWLELGTDLDEVAASVEHVLNKVRT